MKSIQDLPIVFLGIDQESRGKIFEITLRIFYWVFVALLTFRIAGFLGYPINIDLSKGILDSLISNYFIVVPISIWVIILLCTDIIILFLSYAIFWALSLWLIYNKAYGLINFMNKRDVPSQHEFLEMRMNLLMNNLSNQEHFKIEKDTVRFIQIMFAINEFCLAAITVYFSIIKPFYPNLSSPPITALLFFMETLALFFYSPVYYYLGKKYFIERLIRRTQKRLKKYEQK